MKSQIPHTVRCNISGEAAEEIWHWSLLGVKGLKGWENVLFELGGERARAWADRPCTVGSAVNITFSSLWSQPFSFRVFPLVSGASPRLFAGKPCTHVRHGRDVCGIRTKARFDANCRNKTIINHISNNRGTHAFSKDQKRTCVSQYRPSWPPSWKASRPGDWARKNSFIPRSFPSQSFKWSAKRMCHLHPHFRFRKQLFKGF